MRVERLSLQKQLLIYMALLIAVPLLLMMALGNYFYASGFDEQSTEFSTQMLEQVRMNIESSVGTVDRMLEYLAMDEDVINYLRLQDFYSPGRIRLETAVRDRMRIFADVDPALVGGLLVAGENGLYASNDLYRITRYPLTRDSWYAQAVAADGERVLISRPIGRNIRHYRNYSANSIVSVVRAVKDPETGELLGVVIADMLTQAIEERIRDVTLGKSGYVFVQDSAGEIVYAPVNDTVYRIRAEWLTQAPGIHVIDGQRYQLLCAHSDVTQWNTVGMFPLGETPEQMASLRSFTVIAASVFIVLATVVSLRFSASFVGPISKLRRLMSEAESGNLDVSFDTRGYFGEIRQLGGSFNSMMDKIRGLLQMVYKEQRDKREAEIRTLQAQINPHFLYNTLDTIHWMAEEHQAMDIVKLVSALTKLFRISLSRGREVISLAEEMEHVRSYLYIQKVRYEDKLHYRIDVPEALLRLRVNKLILQPLVENAIYHGIKQKRGEGHIQLSGERRGDTLVLRVADDGAGMSPEKCARLNEELRDGGGRVRDHGYGIFNVNDRIRLSYGREYGLHYRINEYGGITVELVCPAVPRSEAETEAEGKERS